MKIVKFLNILAKCYVFLLTSQISSLTIDNKLKFKKMIVNVINMFGWLTKIFKKKGRQEPVGQPANQDVPLDIASNQAESQAEIVQRHTEPAAGPAMQKSSQEQERKERICPKCGAPNDVFTDICWLCKEKSW